MTIHIIIPSGRKKSVAVGTTAGQILADNEFDIQRGSIIAARVNNEIVSVSYNLGVNCSLQPVLLNSRDGMNIYRRSLCYLLAIASKRVFKKRRLVIGHSLGKGYYYYLDGMDVISPDSLAGLKAEMQRLVDANLPITRHKMSYTEALAYFKQNNQPDTALLIKNSNAPRIPVNRCGDFIDISHGPLVPSTGMLKVFDIKAYPPGFILRYPPMAAPGRIQAFADNPLLFSVYQEYKHWGKILKLNCIGRLNEKIKAGGIKEFIEIAEALHNSKIMEIAEVIRRKADTVSLVLIAGPSSSGKTTFMKKLSIQLKVFGITPLGVSIDNYFLPRSLTPKDKRGNYDYETLDAVDVKLLNNHLTLLLQGREVPIPVYDFEAGMPKKTGTKMKLGSHSIILMEGIHGLNPRLTPLVPPEKKLKIYVSALTQLNLDDHNRIPTTDVRLLRRIIRDYRFRGHSALTTFKMWASVHRGEAKYIFPFQNNADMAFNSSLDYELAVLKVYAEPLLKTIEPSHREYSEVQRMLAFLDNVIPIPSGWVPTQSILREFIGESSFSY
jgi:uridine kinase